MSSGYLPRVCARARTEIVINLVLFAVTMGAFALFFVENYLNNRDVLIRFLPGSGAERIVYNLIFAIFMFGSFTYQVSRLSFFLNVRKRTRTAMESLARFRSRKSAAPHMAARTRLLLEGPVARAITGTRWSGPRFFGMRDRAKGAA